MIVYFRVDSSIRIGSGHVMRCLTLADRLRQSGADVTFISRDFPGHCGPLITERGYKLRLLPPVEASVAHKGDWLAISPRIDARETGAILEESRKPVDWLVVDHYGIDVEWEKDVRSRVRRLMVIDDLANRCHQCDLLLDQNYYKGGEARYCGLVPARCRLLLGPRYALLRPEFVAARKLQVKKEGPIRRILIFFGGSDPTNETEKTLQAIEQLNRRELHLDVVVGAANPNRKRIQELCSRIPNAHYHCQIDYMARLMAEADLAIGAGGATHWERCYMGLPAITVVVADNQAETTGALMQAGALHNLGPSATVTVDLLAHAIADALDHPEAIRNMALRAKGVMGEESIKGVDAVVAAMEEIEHAQT